MVVSKICCIGAEDIGVLTCIVIASKCPEIRVTVVDKPDVISQWNSDSLPINDNEVLDVVKKCRYRNLYFVSEYPSTIKSSEVIFVSYKTSIIQSAEGKSIEIDLKYLDDIIRMIINYSDSNKIIVERSTTPGKVAEKIHQDLQSRCEPDIKLDVLSNPEFINEGSSVIQSILHPSKVIIGCVKTPSGKTAAQAVSNIYERWVPSQNICVINMNAAEELKVISTALVLQWMYTKMAFTKICKESKINMDDIVKFLGIQINKKIFGEGKNLLNICSYLKLMEVYGNWETLLDGDSEPTIVTDSLHSTGEDAN